MNIVIEKFQDNAHCLETSNWKYTDDVSSNIWTLGKCFAIVALLTWFDIIYFWGALEVISEQSNTKVSCLKTVFAFIQNVNISF